MEIIFTEGTVTPRNCATVLAWLNDHIGAHDVTITDRSAELAMLALQGPKSQDALQPLVEGKDLGEVGYYKFTFATVCGIPDVRISRTGYTGEDGFEIYFPPTESERVWNKLLEVGAPHGLKPIGLGARDTLRLEAGMALYGHEIDDNHNPVEAGLGFAVKMDKPNFIGRAAVLAKRETGLEQRLVQFKLTDSEPLLYHNEPILRNGENVGYLSSGGYGHHVGAAIGMGYVPCKGESVAELLDSTFEIDVMGTRVRAEVQLKPFYDPKSERVKV